MTFARTILGDVDAADLGITYAHEHLVLDSPLVAAAFPHILLDDSAVAIREVFRCKAVGVQTMVDAMPSAGRDVSRLAQISQATGMNIIAATGLHHDRYYGPRHWTSRVGANELAQLFVDDIQIGIDAFDYTGPIIRRTPYRAGIIKVATGGGQLSPRDELLFDAAARAHSETGAPILTHCEHGQGALEQVAALMSRGVPPTSILLSHIDKVPDLSYHIAIAQTGAWMLLDQSLRQPEITAALIGDLTAAGFSSQITLGTDGARRSLWVEYGGAPGLAWLAHDFTSILTRSGLTDDDVSRILTSNPARALAINSL